MKIFKGIRLIGTTLWWCYFAILCWVFASNIMVLHARVHFHSIASVLSRRGFEVPILAFGLIGLACYLRKVPLLHPFFWGVVCMAQLVLSLYFSSFFVVDLVRFDDFHIVDLFGSWGMAKLTIFDFAPLLLVYVLWRYSSASSPVWQRPRIPWRRLADRLGDAVRHLRRA